MAQNFLTPVGLYNSASNPTVPSPAAGDIYYNTSASEIRVYNGTAWVAIGGGGAAAAGTLTGTTLASNVVNSSLTSFGASPTITTPALSLSTTADNGTGRIAWDNSNFRLNIGTGAAQRQITADNATATLTSKTISGADNTVSTTGTLTIGTGLSGTSFNGSSNVTIAINSTVATLTGTQTFTNKTFGGATFTSAGKTAFNMPTATISGSSGINNIEILNGANAANNDSFITFHNQGTFAINFGLSRATNRLMWGGWSAGAAQYEIADTSTSQTFSNKTISGASNTINNLNASNLSSGTVPTARLGTGTANSTTFLRGDGTWSTVSAAAASATTQGTLFGLSNSTGNNNSAGLGYDVGNGFQGGYGNMAMGVRACKNLNLTSSGSTNTIIGYDNTSRTLTGSFNQNTLIGRDIAAYGSGGFNDNVVVGYAISIGTGSRNTLVGHGAGNSVTSGSENTFIGNNAGNTGSMWQNTGNNNIIIGYQATGTTQGISNQITFGNSSISGLRCQITSISSLSDIRDKKDVVTSTLGLDFINKVRPVTFTWNMRDGGKVGQKELGFIAQELLEVEEEAGLREYTQIVDTDNPEKLEAAPNKMFPIVIKAIQELSAKIVELEKQLQEAKR